MASVVPGTNHEAPGASASTREKGSATGLARGTSAAAETRSGRPGPLDVRKSRAGGSTASLSSGVALCPTFDGTPAGAVVIYARSATTLPGSPASFGFLFRGLAGSSLLRFAGRKPTWVLDHRSAACCLQLHADAFATLQPAPVSLFPARPSVGPSCSLSFSIFDFRPGHDTHGPESHGASEWTERSIVTVPTMAIRSMLHDSEPRMITGSKRSVRITEEGQRKGRSDEERGPEDAIAEASIRTCRAWSAALGPPHPRLLASAWHHPACKTACTGLYELIRAELAGAKPGTGQRSLVQIQGQAQAQRTALSRRSRQAMSQCSGLFCPMNSRMLYHLSARLVELYRGA
ncbi:hypothetical protein PaG_06551 [Moesziomyces aphidis]|uniref:Uncharacterized protein n=1 Tax=Moesziomyces aphidis TaxID=84754 RepID=W3VFM9_MOEAP|nr:hypothetical protein PaG_06551 [Moesziomyces aphidis]